MRACVRALRFVKSLDKRSGFAGVNDMKTCANPGGERTATKTGDPRFTNVGFNQK